MLYTVKTTEAMTTVKKEIEEKAKEIGFGLLNTYDFKTILEGKGFPVEEEISVFEICNPAGAQKALTEIPQISVYLPCRISVYEEGGMTVLSTIGLEEMVSVAGEKEEFKAYMSVLFEDLKKVMHSWDT